ncbi:MAG: site-specific tyrosine recombinase/integron integrase [archaeon]
MYIPDLIQKHGLRRGLSHQTIRTYSFCIRKFFLACNKDDPKKINKKDITNYIDSLVHKGYSGSTLNTNLNALRLLYNEILHKRLLVNFRFSRAPKRLPVYLTQSEVLSLLSALKNKKHKLMIMLLYSAGLRVSELLNLKKSDFDNGLAYGWVRSGKGNKDRPFIIANSIKNELNSCLSENCRHSHSYLFANQKGFQMSRSTIFAVLKEAAKKAGIEKKVHPHTLRHSFATHLIENKSDIIQVQSLLGHASVRTTMVYLHSANPNLFCVRSPLDVIMEKNVAGSV